MSVVASMARKELLELRYNKGVLMSIAAFTIVFCVISPSGSSDLSMILLSTMMGMYAAFGISGQAFNSEKQSGSLETTFCGPVELRELWLGKIIGTLVPALVVAYAAVGIVLAEAFVRSTPIVIGLTVAVYLIAILPALVAAFIGIMGFIQLNFGARQTRLLSTAALALIISLLTASLSLPQEGNLISWQAIAIIGLAAVLLLTSPALLVNRLSKERIVLTSEA
ncbi:MAG: hypothetical protein SA339_01290 [Methanomassiliicoccus sp.]|nr:hypothetical protein [Methanomassiliicoccus sp.]